MQVFVFREHAHLVVATSAINIRRCRNNCIPQKVLSPKESDLWKSESEQMWLRSLILDIRVRAWFIETSINRINRRFAYANDTRLFKQSE